MVSQTGIVGAEDLAVEVAVGRAGGAVQHGDVLPVRAGLDRLALALVAAGRVCGRDIGSQDGADAVRRAEQHRSLVALGVGEGLVAPPAGLAEFQFQLGGGPLDGLALALPWQAFHNACWVSAAGSSPR